MLGVQALCVASAMTSAGDSAENKPVSTRVFRKTKSPKAFLINSGLIRTCAVRRLRIEFISGLCGGKGTRVCTGVFFVCGVGLWSAM